MLFTAGRTCQAEGWTSRATSKINVHSLSRPLPFLQLALILLALLQTWVAVEYSMTKRHDKASSDVSPRSYRSLEQFWTVVFLTPYVTTVLSGHHWLHFSLQL